MTSLVTPRHSVTKFAVLKVNLVSCIDKVACCSLDTLCDKSSPVN